jgi:hypothetical protein
MEQQVGVDGLRDGGRKGFFMRGWEDVWLGP